MARPITLEAASSIGLIARQLGAVVSNEQIGEEYSSGGCGTEDSLTNYFRRFDISVFFRKVKKEDLFEKKFLYPCVLIKKKRGSDSFNILTD